VREKVGQNERIASLDLLRLVAALAVVAFHYLFRGAAGEPFLDVSYQTAAPFALYGYLGVNLFFLISGFVIAWSAEGERWERFAIARFTRLYPAFLACMTVTFVVLVLADDPKLSATAGQFAANLFMFSPAVGQPFMDGVYWSIILELVFYGWVTLALFLGVFDRWKLPLVAGWLAICALNEFVFGNGAARLLFVTEFGPLFAAGILVHHIYSHGRTRYAMVLLAASFVLSCATMRVTQGWMQDAYGVSVPTLALPVVNLGLHGLLIAAVALRRLIAPAPLVLALGGLTYPLYLLHQNIGYVVINEFAPFMGKWTALAVTVSVMLIASWLVCRYIEKPVRKPLARGLARMVEWVGLSRSVPASGY
jgi:peptidoglycan/LPS O-acetylase OafA/YrhL